MRYCPWRNRSIDTVDLKKGETHNETLYKIPASRIAVALCLSLAEPAEAAAIPAPTRMPRPDSFEGMVKDSDRMVSLSDYGGTWTGDDGSTMLVEAGGDGDGALCGAYDAVTR